MHEPKYELDESAKIQILTYPNSLENALVVVSNMIARATTKWTLQETKMFLCYVSNIQMRDSQNWVTISKKDLLNTLKIEIHQKNMRAIFKSMVDKSFVDLDSENEEEWMSGVLLTSIKSTKKDISIQFNQTYIPLLDQLSKQFTEFYLSYVMEFTHMASYKLYVYLVSWAKHTDPPEYEVIPKHKINQIFGLEKGKYWRNYGTDKEKFDWSSFERFVLNPAIEEINEVKACDMHIISCVKKKDGKFVLGYEIEYAFVDTNTGYFK